MKRNEKDEIRKLSLNKLQEVLQQKETEILKLEVQMRYKNGTSSLIRNYPSKTTEDKGIYGNVKKIRKEIAFIKQVLHLKTIRSI
jgi:ribosomal protein L29